MQNFASTRPSVWFGLSKTSLLDTAIDEIHGIICKLLSFTNVLSMYLMVKIHGTDNKKR